jgi:MFS family permease
MSSVVSRRRLRSRGTRSVENGTAPVEPDPDTAAATASPRPDPRPLRRDLHCSVADGTFFQLMVGMGETYFPAFILAMGMGEIASGLVISVPVLIGSLMQLVSPYMIHLLGSNRRWVVMCVAIQAACFLPLVVAALIGKMPTWAAFGVIAGYWAAGQAGGPAWNAWMENVVPRPVRASFFAWRTRLGQAGMLLGFAIGGLSLQYGREFGTPGALVAFSCLFTVAALCRFLSGWYLFQQSDPGPDHNDQQHVSLRELLRRIASGGSERMLLYFLAVQGAAQLSGPYFTPFLLRQLHFSYVEFMLLLGVSLVAKIIALPACGRLAYRYGAHTLLWIGGIGIMPVSGLWLHTNSFAGLLVVQFIAGVTWAAYELAMMLLFFESVKPDERTSILTLFNVGNAAALTVGSVLGGLFLMVFDKSPNSYLVLFGLSSLARAMTLVVLYFCRPAKSS